MGAQEQQDHQPRQVPVEQPAKTHQKPEMGKKPRYQQPGVKYCTALYTNADCLMNKRCELDANIRMFEPEIIAITEVTPKYCKTPVQECELRIDGFTPFHNLEAEKRGVLIQVKDSLKPTKVEAFSNAFQEALFVNCNFSNNETLTVGLVYRSPNSSDENNTKLNELLTMVAEAKPANLLILGDFNYKEINWEAETCTGNATASTFLDACRDCYLIQHQREPTRIREGQTPTLDDLVLTDTSELILELTSHAGLGKSDHTVLVAKLALTESALETQNQPSRPYYPKADYVGIKRELSEVNWEEELLNLNTNDTANRIKAKINELVEKYVPMSGGRGKKRRLWMDRGTLASVRKKHQLFRRWLATRDGEEYLEYVTARNQARKACRKAEKELEKKHSPTGKDKPQSLLVVRQKQNDDQVRHKRPPQR